jgi:hypothetical protein
VPLSEPLVEKLRLRLMDVQLSLRSGSRFGQQESMSIAAGVYPKDTSCPLNVGTVHRRLYATQVVN